MSEIDTYLLENYKTMSGVELRDRFRRNMRCGYVPVALYTCIKCGTMLGDNMKCPECEV